jgi:hypothetical protein
MSPPTNDQQGHFSVEIPGQLCVEINTGAYGFLLIFLSMHGDSRRVRTSRKAGSVHSRTRTKVAASVPMDQ